MQVQVCAAEAQQTMNLCYGSHALLDDPCFKKEVPALGGGESVDRLYQGDEARSYLS